MAFAVDESIAVATPPEQIWRLLEEPATWSTWWPACREARTADRRALHDGSRFELTLRPSWMTLRFHSLVGAATPARYLHWEGHAPGVVVRHSYYLERRPDGAQVRLQVTLGGPGALALRLLGQTSALQRSLRESLKGAKRLAERAL